MSVQFAKDEKVIKSFKYATVGYNKKKGKHDTFKNLIITNKRIIHESVNDKRSNEIILRQEMPVTDAKYVKTTMGKISNIAYLLQAILFAIIAATAIFVSSLDFAEKFYVLFLVIAAPFAILTFVKLAAYFASRSKVVSFSIFTDHVVTPVICTAAVEANADDTQGKKSKSEPTLEIRVNADAAREIADGLGAAILDAINYKEEEPANNLQEAILAYASVETEETPVDSAEAEETEEANEEA
ncbi:MAG: hypothetical protein E7584_02420 [Ruminococcaceae bacterium]|nr:hypothetical protein [Oscillospiraceae bacterium]